MSVYPLFSGVLAFDRMGESEGEAGQGVCAHSGMTLGRSVEVRAERGFRLNTKDCMRRCVKWGADFRRRPKACAENQPPTSRNGVPQFR